MANVQRSEKGRARNALQLQIGVEMSLLPKNKGPIWLLEIVWISLSHRQPWPFSLAHSMIFYLGWGWENLGQREVVVVVGIVTTQSGTIKVSEGSEGSSLWPHAVFHAVFT